MLGYMQYLLFDTQYYQLENKQNDTIELKFEVRFFKKIKINYFLFKTILNIYISLQFLYFMIKLILNIKIIMKSLSLRLKILIKNL